MPDDAVGDQRRLGQQEGGHGVEAEGRRAMIDPQTKIGSRPIDMPLVRMVKVVTMMLTPATVTETTNVQIVMAKASMRRWRLHRERGVGRPARVGATERRSCERIGTTAETTSQKLSAFSLGNAMSLAPIMIGRMKLANGPETMMIVAMIMTMPWIVTIEL